MELHWIDWAIIILYMLLSLVIGIMYKDKADKSLSDFFLGGRNLPWHVAGISMVATTFAADTPLAVNELVAQNGISGNWLWWNMLLGGMLTTFFFARLWRRAEILTEIEFIEFRYSGAAAAFLRGFKSIYMGLFMNSLIIGWVNVALIVILKVFFDVPEEYLLWIAGAAMLITAIYSSISGLWGVAITDMVQFVIAMTGCIILAALVLNSDKVGGIEGLKAKLPPSSLDFFPKIGESAAGTATTLTIGIGSFLAFLSIWWASWYPGAEPGGGGYIAQRMMSTKNEKHSIYATLFFQIAHYCLRPWPWIIVGLCTIILYPDLSMADKKLGYVLAMKEFLPTGLKGLLLVAFLAAYMSTISTQLNWGASYVVNDFYYRFINPAATQKKLVSVSRLVIIVLTFISLFVASKVESISGVWSFIMECGAGLGLVLILRWYWWRINAWSEITATVAPFIGYYFSKYVFNYQFPSSFFLTVGFTTISWIIVTYLTAPTQHDKLASFYKKVKPDGLWKPVIEAGGFRHEKSRIGNLLVCWASSVIMTYCILFMTGYIIFKEWHKALLCLLTGIISFLVLRIFMKKTKIFSD